MDPVIRIKTNLETMCDQFDTNTNKLNVEELSNLFRELRKLCALNEEFRKSLFDDIFDLEKMRKLLQTIQRLESNEENKLCVRIGLQVVANSIVQCEGKHVERVWTSMRDFLLGSLLLNDSKLNTIVMMIAYNSYKALPHIIQQDTEMRQALFDQVEVGNEFAQIYLEDILYPESDSIEFQDFFASLSNQQKLYVIEYLKVHIKPNVRVNHFINIFSREALSILSNHENGQDVRVVILSLELLSDYSVSSLYQTELQNNTDLVRTVLEFLKAMHAAGKQNGTKRFAPEQDLTKMFTPSEDIVFGVKVTLVKLVANLVWSHQQNQNLVRMTECFPVLLECCNLDAKNPLIKEWSVFALRNCCDNNAENQSIIAELNKVGDTTYVDLNAGLNLAAGVTLAPITRNTTS